MEKRRVICCENMKLLQSENVSSPFIKGKYIEREKILHSC